MTTKLEELRRTTVGNISESMGGGRMSGVAVPGEHRPIIKGPNARFADTKRRSDVSDIAVGKITVDEGQPRKTFDLDELDRLAASIKKHGLLAPIRVRWSEEMQLYVIQVGERRFQATLRAGLPTIAAIVVEHELTPGELRSIQIVENALRVDVPPMEIARAYQELMALEGWNQTELAKELGITHSAVAKAMATLTLAPEVQAMVDEGKLDGSKAYQLSKVEDADQQRELAERVVHEKMSRDETARVVKQAAPGGRRAGGAKPRAKPKAPKLPTERKHVAGNRLKVVVTGRKGFDVLDWVEALRDALGAAEAVAAGQGGAGDSDAA